MKKSRKEFIKQAHSNACSEWKEKIEKEFPELFKEDALVVGKWYKRNDNKIWFLTEIREESSFGYGFNFEGNWSDISKGYNYTLDLTLATDKEVEEALIKEAKKRGFKEGVKYNNFIANRVFTFRGGLSYNNNNTLNDLNENTIFKNGKWATIVETITKEQAEKELGKTILN
jgi:hypothetical protein